MIIGSWEMICGPWGTSTYIGRRTRYDGRRPRYDGRRPQNVQNIPVIPTGSDLEDFGPQRGLF